MAGAFFCNAPLMKANPLIPSQSASVFFFFFFFFSAPDVIWHAEETLHLIGSCIQVHSLLVSVKEPDMPI